MSKQKEICLSPEEERRVIDAILLSGQKQEGESNIEGWGKVKFDTEGKTISVKNEKGEKLMDFTELG